MTGVSDACRAEMHVGQYLTLVRVGDKQITGQTT